MTTDVETTPPTRTPVTFAFGPLLIVAAVAILAAGALHFYSSPMHFAEAKAYGIFMLVLAAVQVASGAWLLLRRTLASALGGIVVMVASLVVWLGVTFIKIPYGDGPESPETIAYVTKLVEVVALVALVVMVMMGASLVRATGRAAVAVLLVALLIGAASGGAAYGAGFVAAKVLPDLGPSDEGGMHMGPASSDGSSSASHDGMNMGGSANASANATTTTNSSATNSTTGKDPNMPDDPANCMSGMDMPGCTMAQADYYYKHTKAGSSPPDRALAPVIIELKPQGDGQSGKFTVENGTQQLLISIKIKDDGPGPYAALGPGGNGDLKVELKGPSGSKTITLNGTTQSVGVDPASTLFKSYVDGLALPGEGAWTVNVLGQGQNVHVETDITERFYL